MLLLIILILSLPNYEFQTIHDNQSPAWNAATSKISFLNQSDARVALAPWQPYPAGRFQFQFRTLSPSIPLLSLSSPQLQISCSISGDGLVTAERRDSSRSDQLILSDTHVISNDWVTVSLYSLSAGLRVEVTTGTLSQSAVLLADLSAGGPLVPVLGLGGFLGCMKGVKMSNQSAAPLLHSPPVDWDGVVIGARCLDRCENVSCGEGECVNAWTGHFCDCSDTLMAGEQCEEETAKFGVAGNQSAVFFLNSTRRLHSFSFVFQALTRDGTLLRIHSTHSYLTSRDQGAILRRESAVFQLSSQSSHLEVSAVIGGVKFSALAPPLLLTETSAQNWNYVTIHFRSHSHIYVTVNRAVATLTTSNWEWNAERVELGERLIGCLSQLIVNRFQVLSEREVSGVSRNSCPTYRSISLHIPFSDTRIQGLLDIQLSPSNLILQMEFLLSGGEQDRGLLLLSFQEQFIRARVLGDTVHVMTPLRHIQSHVLVRDSAWHKLELKLRTTGNRSWLRVSVDGHIESAVFSTSGSAADILIGQLRLGGDNSTSLGGCLRNVALFGSNLSLSSLVSDRAADQSDFCPVNTPCDFSPCANGARCETGGDNFPLCHCARHFSGRFCTNATTSHLEPEPLLAFLLPPLVVVLIIAVAVFAGLLAAVKISRRSTGSYRTWEETGISIIQESNYSLRDHLSDSFMPPPKPALEWPV